MCPTRQKFTTPRNALKRKQMVRIASYNIQKCVGMDMLRNPTRTMVAIRALRADIVVLQEADKRLAPRPSALPPELARARGLEPVDFGPPQGSLGWHGNAMLIASTVTLRETACLDLPGIEPRGAIRADLDTPLGAIRVVGVHLGLLRRSRLAQLTEIHTHLQKLTPLPTVIAGDFNEWGAMGKLSPALPGYDFVHTGQTYPAARPTGSLDSFALTAEFNAVDSRVLKRVPARTASDHLPVWVDLQRATADA